MRGLKVFVLKSSFALSGPIVAALEMGADIVVTGRTADSALALAPCIHKLNWDMSDFDLMASGSLAGHLIECGGQVMKKHLSFCTHFIPIMGTPLSDLGEKHLLINCGSYWISGQN